VRRSVSSLFFSSVYLISSFFSFYRFYSTLISLSLVFSLGRSPWRSTGLTISIVGTGSGVEFLVDRLKAVFFICYSFLISNLIGGKGTNGESLLVFSLIGKKVVLGGGFLRFLIRLGFVLEIVLFANVDTSASTTNAAPSPYGTVCGTVSA